MYPLDTRTPAYPGASLQPPTRMHPSAPRLKLNCVVVNGVNTDELPHFVELTRDQEVDVRFIEWMPFDNNQWKDDKFFSYEVRSDACGKSGGGGYHRFPRDAHVKAKDGVFTCANGLVLGQRSNRWYYRGNDDIACISCRLC